MGELVDRDEEHLRLLKLCYYVLAGMTGLFSLFPILFLSFFGSLISSGAIPATQPANTHQDPRVFGMIMLGLGVVSFVAAGVNAFLTFWTGRSLGEHRRRTFCIVIAALTCLYIPWGTAIGVCTIMVLNRPSVKVLFGEQPPQQPFLGTP